MGGGLHLEAARPGMLAVRLSASVTLSNPRAALTLHAGPTFAAGDALAGLGELSAAAALTVRLTNRIDLAGEAWVSGRGGAADALGLVALRLRYWRLALDAGATVSARDREIGPWLGFTFDVLR